MMMSQVGYNFFYDSIIVKDDIAVLHTDILLDAFTVATLLSRDVDMALIL